MIIQSSGRHRLAANWHGPFTRGSYGCTDGRVETLPVCMPLPAARPGGCLQRRLGRRRRIPGADHASGGGGVPLQLCQVRHMAGRRIPAQRGLFDHRRAGRGPRRRHTRRDRSRQDHHGQETGSQAVHEGPGCGEEPHPLPQLIRGKPFAPNTNRAGMINALSIRANIIGVNSASAMLFNDEAAAGETLAALKTDPHTIAAGLYTRDNRIFARYVRDDQKEQVALPLHLADQSDGHRFEDDGLILFRKIVFKGEPISTVYIHSDLQEMNARIWQYLGITLFVLLASSSLALVVSSRLQRRITQPLFHLVETAKTVSREKDYSVRAVADSKDEMGILVSAFNDMLTEIQIRNVELKKSSDELEQRVIARTQELQSANKELEAFSYSVSHDLRAPLRHIDGFSDLLQKHAATLDEKGRRYLKPISDSANQMDVL